MASPYDQSFKSLADSDPEALLRWMGALDPEESVTATPPRELYTPMHVADMLYVVRSGEARRLVHIEAQTRYHSSLPERILQYGALSWLRHRLPVVSHVVLLTARDCPATLTGHHEMHAGDLRMRYTHIKLWELRPDEVLAADSPNLWPFVPLMRSEASHLRLAGQRLRRITDDWHRRELVSRFIMLGGLRHDRKDLFRLLEGAMITHEDMMESSVYRWVVEQGECRLLQRQLERRFGPLPPRAVEMIQTANPDTVEAWAMRLVDGRLSRLEDLLA